jgi:hypothetical protein
MRRFVLPMLAVLLVLGVVLALTLGSAAPGAPITAASNQRAAVRDAHVLLGRLVLPPDARSSSREPLGSGLDTVGVHFRNPNKVDKHAWWVVPRPEQAVVAFVKAHPPAGAKLEEESVGSTGARGLQFKWPAMESVLRRRALAVRFAALPNGSTAVMAEAQDVGDVPRPASEQIPSSVRVLDVAVVPVGEEQRRLLSIAVTDPATVSQIAAKINHLATVQPYTGPGDRAEAENVIVVFGFKATRGGPVLAQAQQIEGGRPMNLWINKHRQTPLLGGYSVIQQTEKLLHVTLH